MKRKKMDPKGGAAMSFDEIGQQLGITRGGAWMAYKSAMKKLQRGGRLRQLELLLALAKAKEQPGLR